MFRELFRYGARMAFLGNDGRTRVTRRRTKNGSISDMGNEETRTVSWFPSTVCVRTCHGAPVTSTDDASPVAPDCGSAHGQQGSSDACHGQDYAVCKTPTAMTDYSLNEV